MKFVKRDLLAWLAIIFVGMLTAAATTFAQPGASLSMTDTRSIEQPVAPVREVTDDYFGTKIVDPYRWMEEPKSAELAEWMKAQNDYTRSNLDPSPVRNQVLKRINEMTNPNVVVSSVKKVGPMYFYLKIAPGDADRKLYFRYGLKGVERLLVDPTKIAEGGKRFSIISFSPSQDGLKVSYLVSAGGAELGEIRVVDTSTSRDLGVRIERARWEAGSWLPDNKSFLYVQFPKLESDASQTEQFQKRRVYLHRLGDDTEKDRPVFGFEVNPGLPVDPKLLPFPTVPVGSRYAFVTLNTGVSPNSEIYVARSEELSKPGIQWRKLASFEDEVNSFEVRGDELFLLTYNNAPRYKIVKTSVSKPDPAKASIVVAESQALITDMCMTADSLIVQKSDAGIGKLQQLDLKNGKLGDIKLPFDGVTISSMTSDPRGKELLFTTASWVKSNTIYSYDSGKKKLDDTLLQPASSIDTSRFESIQVKAKAPDGTLIPLSIIHKKGIKLDGKNPTVLSGYGSYGISQNPFFVPAFFAWMEQGGIVAFAHVRGGGEYGREWHLGGFRKNKPNTWNDFIACAEYLINENYTSPQMLAAHGASAGGILVGNAIATRPDLFGAAVIQVGLNNMLRYETTANGVPNTAEFGSVKTEEGFRDLLEMDAYHKIKSGVQYPAVILTHGINDPRVEPWFSAKLAARLQAATSSNQPVFLRIDYDAGHGIGSSRRQANEESADVIAFLAESLKSK